MDCGCISSSVMEKLARTLHLSIYIKIIKKKMLSEIETFV